MSLTVFGSVAFDEIETPFGSSGKIIGGAATYITASASYFADKLNLISVIGNDFPKEEIEFLKSRGADLEGLEVKSDQKSFFWKGKYHNDMNSRDSLVTELNAADGFSPVVPEAYRDTEFLLLGNWAPAVQTSVVKQMNKKPKLVVTDTMNFWMDIAWDDLMVTLQHTDVLCINDEEARQLSKEYSLLKAARKIKTLGPKTVIIKKGEHGALLFSEDKIFYVPALPLEAVFDPTGAGDTFVGGFTGYLAKTGDISFENMKRALVYGSAMASFCVERFGLERLRKLSGDEIAVRASKFLELMHLEGGL